MCNFTETEVSGIKVILLDVTGRSVVLQKKEKARLCQNFDILKYDDETQTLYIATLDILEDGSLNYRIYRSEGEERPVDLGLVRPDMRIIMLKQEAPVVHEATLTVQNLELFFSQVSSLPGQCDIVIETIETKENHNEIKFYQLGILGRGRLRTSLEISISRTVKGPYVERTDSERHDWLENNK